MGPSRPSRELGFMTSSQAPRSAAPSYPTAGVGQVIWAENYEGPFLLPLSSSTSRPSPHSILTTARDAAFILPPPFTAQRPEAIALPGRAESRPGHRPSAPASPPETDAPPWQPKPRFASTPDPLCFPFGRAPQACLAAGTAPQPRFRSGAMCCPLWAWNREGVRFH